MRTKLIDWAERRAREEAARKATKIAEHLRERIAGASVEAREAAVIISGRGIVKRWLIDPDLRFLSGDLK